MRNGYPTRVFLSNNDSELTELMRSTIRARSFPTVRRNHSQLFIIAIIVVFHGVRPLHHRRRVELTNPRVASRCTGGGFRLRNLKHVKPIWRPRYGDVRVAKAAPICRARLVAAEKVVRASVVDDPRIIQHAENFVSLYVGFFSAAP